MDKVKVVVVGAGPAGLSAAYVLAKAGIEVVVAERGKYAGAKNMMGGVLYSATLAKIIPDFYKDAPLERAVVKKKWIFLGEGNEMSFEFKSDNFQPPFYNHSFVVLRAKFDQWFAQKAEEAGAIIAYETVVDDLMLDNDKVVGVKIRTEDGGQEELPCDIVIAADGVNSLIAQKADLRGDLKPATTALSVKEVIELPENIINERLGLENNEGVAYEYIIPDKRGKYIGSGFLYANKDSISIGLGLMVDALAKTGINPHDFLEDFKKWSSVKALIKGGKLKEYSAHLICEAGYLGMPKIFAPGLLVIGEAAGLINTVYKEGTNLAMESGRIAAETAIIALTANDFSENTLSIYAEKMKKSFAIKDLKRFKNIKYLLENPEIFSRVLPMLKAMEESLVCNNVSKAEHLKKARKIFFKGYAFRKIIKDIWNLLRSVI